MSKGTDAPGTSLRPRMMEPLTIKNVRFKNRIVRSAVGGQLATSEGSVTPAWTNFERRFAKTGVSALVSATVNVDEKRNSPLYYAHLANDHFVGTLKKAIARVKQDTDCAYILQIGDPGYHTQTSLFSQEEDGQSASRIFDLLFGYRNMSVPMTAQDIQRSVASFASGARRAKEAGCDGIEVTASKGYLIQQFLNPWSNRRDDEYGGSKERRFRFLREVVIAVRKAVGPDFLFGVRISAQDHNGVPVNVRGPPPWFKGNGIEETLYFVKELESLGVDFLHMSNGFGFINPKGNPGDFPVAEVRRLFNSNRHLSFKAWLRSTVVNAVPAFLLQAFFGMGWNLKGLTENIEMARRVKKAVGIPVIANGGFQNGTVIEETLGSGACDMVSVARPLLANPKLLEILQTRDEPENRCSFCNRCAVATATGPVGCYDLRRFGSTSEMEAKIIEWVTDPDQDQDEGKRKLRLAVDAA